MAAVFVRRPEAGRRALSIDVVAGSEMALVDVLDRLLADGVVVSGDLTLAIADVDLVHLSLRTLITSITGEEEQ
jgi:hypothetical protein